MIKIQTASPVHVEGICKVCAKANRATYADLYTESYLEQIIEQFYNPARVLDEVTNKGREWGGYIVAVEDGQVVGACGGGMIDQSATELYVMYLDPARRNEGIGTKLLDAFTKQQIDRYGATEQWVSVQKGNDRGIPFYEARGFTFSHESKGYGSEEAAHYTSLRYVRKI
ncbi:Ribosomal protein S18 acetylase RimI [Halobacillus dabanensis]|uniref:Ribosomal protein S18 acetylase RimI n=1 Tax=Halobacillus dabanensis TaxID=240302 RepID=A0A1I3TI62_HALDA|nr:GNAT family N-acetyltransferase [Halobacillus dabanensis]SFJ69321.1 Ribosomal protein S18 acetylase RimI [Halobacillus dabanensis]